MVGQPCACCCDNNLQHTSDPNVESVERDARISGVLRYYQLLHYYFFGESHLRKRYQEHVATTIKHWHILAPGNHGTI